MKEGARIRITEGTLNGMTGTITAIKDGWLTVHMDAGWTNSDIYHTWVAIEGEEGL